MSTITIIRVAGLALGAAASTALLVTAQIPRPAGALDAALTLTSAPTGELAVEPLGTVMQSGRLAYGAPAARATLRVRNQTGRAQRVTLRALPQTGELDAGTRIRVTARAGATELFDGSLGTLRTGSRPVRIEPGGTTQLRITASVLGGAAGREARGRSDEVALDLSSAPAGAER